MRKITIPEDMDFRPAAEAEVLGKLLSVEYKPRRTPGWLSPSGVTDCPRKQVFKLLGLPARPLTFDENRYGEAGTDVHDRYARLLSLAKEQGVFQEVYTELRLEDPCGLGIRGNIDALVLYNGHWIVLECKSISPWAKDLGYYWLKWREQTHCYLHLARANGYWTDEAIIHVIRRGDENFVGEVRVAWDEETWQRILHRIKQIQDCAAAKVAPPVVECPAGKPPDKSFSTGKVRCEYDTICGDWTVMRRIEEEEIGRA